LSFTVLAYLLFENIKIAECSLIHSELFFLAISTKISIFLNLLRRQLRLLNWLLTCRRLSLMVMFILRLLVFIQINFDLFITFALIIRLYFLLQIWVFFFH
jgi:hypothetical protein